MKAVFDKHSYLWAHSFEHNLMLVQEIERHWNDTLKLRGYVTIMEVYESLGLAVDLEKLGGVGHPSDLWWTYGSKNKIDFRMAPDKNNNVIYLDFNINID